VDKDISVFPQHGLPTIDAAGLVSQFNVSTLRTLDLFYLLTTSKADSLNLLYDAGKFIKIYSAYE